MTELDTKTLTSGKLLAQNTIYGLVGQGIPLVVAVFSIPPLIKGLGTDRFGILTLAWIVISYFSLFDLGLGRALTQLVAEQLGKGAKENSIAELVLTASWLMLGLGLLGSGVFALLSPWLVHRVLNIPVALQAETLRAFYLLAVSIPIITSTAGLVGFLSALQRFDLINAVRIPMGTFMFLGPLLVLPFSNELPPVIGVLLAGRVVFWVINAGFCFKVMPVLRNCMQFRKRLVLPLLRFGGWMTLSNVVGPLMVYMDRFLIGGLISVTAVAYYATPYEVVTKLWIIPGALVSVLFPAFSTSFFQNPKQAEQLFYRGVKYIFLILFPITLGIISFASDGLNVWLGQEFAQNSTPVMQWLAIGVLINGLSQVPFALIQGVGRPEITAKFHLFELPFYAVLLWQLTHLFGIAGAAYAWVTRVVIDTIFLFWAARSLLPTQSMLIQQIRFIVIAILAILPLPMFNVNLFTRLCLFSLLMVTFGLAAWFIFLNFEERKLIKTQLKLVKLA